MTSRSDQIWGQIMQKSKSQRDAKIIEVKRPLKNRRLAAIHFFCFFLCPAGAPSIKSNETSSLS